MRFSMKLLMGAAAMALASTADADDKAAPAAAPAPADATLTCGAPIAWDATEEKLKAQYGAENVVHKDIGGPEGSELFASVVNEKTPEKSFAVVWIDDEKRADPSIIMVNAIWDAESGKITGAPVFATAEGVKAGMSIEDVEKINGKPFKLSGFGWDYGGSPQSFEGGKLQQADDTKCWLSMTFTTTADQVPESVLGEGEIMSNAKDTLAAKPVVGQFMLSYMRPELEGGAPQ